MQYLLTSYKRSCVRSLVLEQHKQMDTSKNRSSHTRYRSFESETSCSDFDRTFLRYLPLLRNLPFIFCYCSREITNIEIKLPKSRIILPNFLCASVFMIYTLYLNVWNIEYSSTNILHIVFHISCDLWRFRLSIKPPTIESSIFLCKTQAVLKENLRRE